MVCCQIASYLYQPCRRRHNKKAQEIPYPDRYYTVFYTEYDTYQWSWFVYRQIMGKIQFQSSQNGASFNSGLALWYIVARMKNSHTIDWLIDNGVWYHNIIISTRGVYRSLQHYTTTQSNSWNVHHNINHELHYDALQYCNAIIHCYLHYYYY